MPFGLFNSSERSSGAKASLQAAKREQERRYNDGIRHIMSHYDYDLAHAYLATGDIQKAKEH